MTYVFPIMPSKITKDKSYAYWKGGFSYDELKKIISTCEGFPKKQAEVSGGYSGEQLEKMRNCSIAWITPNDATKWFYEKLSHYATRVNEDFFGFNLWGFVDDLQYTVYEGSTEKGNHYDWHVDANGIGKSPRKLSFTLQLSDPMDYEGGELWIHNVRREALPKEQSMLHFFPSYTLHRVTPVTSGKRLSLVGWVSGPEFI